MVMRRVLAWFWQWLRQPSLTRRLTLAQLATATLAWVGLAIWAGHSLDAESNTAYTQLMHQSAELVLPLAHVMHHQPRLLQQTVQRIDKVQRAAFVPEAGQEALRMPALFLWWDGVLVYRSGDAPPHAGIDQEAGLVPQVIFDQLWRAYVESSTDGRARFMMLTPATAQTAGFSPWSRSWLVLPLLASLPWLAIPAWLSVRFALKPWSRLTSEIAARAPEDLSPLAFASAHRELKPLTQAVDKWLVRLRAVREREQRFVADAAHELRTPMAAVQVNAEALKARGLAVQDRALLDGLLASNARATHLSAQLLSLARTDNVAAAQPAWVNMDALLQSSLADVEPLAYPRGVVLVLEVTPALPLWGDEASLRMMADNLVGNAIKYSPTGGAVRVGLQREAAGVTLRVIDAGPGIPAHLRTRVFERFFRPAADAQTGSGLGLSIVKSVADQHGATITLSDAEPASDERKPGLCVTVVFPSAVL
jgi:two-component system, OmpR family, sensor histidine kinase QseC